jgi:hypothetical protein
MAASMSVMWMPAMGNELEECLEVQMNHTGLGMTLEGQLQVDA